MRYLNVALFASLIFVAAACHKKKNTGPAVAPAYRSVPNWKSDTLVGRLMDTLGNPVGYDTVYTYTVAGASKIKHNGLEYDIKTSKHPGDDSSSVYPSTIFYATDSLLTINAEPYRFYQNNVWNVSGHNALLISRYASIFATPVYENIYNHY